MIVVLFRSRLRPEFVAEYSVLAKEISGLAAQQPGFISERFFVAPDGERVTIVAFTDEESVISWKKHPRHLEAQHLGRERFYAEYSVQVCSVIRNYSFVWKEEEVTT